MRKIVLLLFLLLAVNLFAESVVLSHSYTRTSGLINMRNYSASCGVSGGNLSAIVGWFIDHDTRSLPLPSGSRVLSVSTSATFSGTCHWQEYIKDVGDVDMSASANGSCSGGSQCEISPPCDHYYGSTMGTISVDCTFEVEGPECEGKDSLNYVFCPRENPNPDYCGTGAEAAAMLASEREKCVSDTGARFAGSLFQKDGYYCVSGSCDDGCKSEHNLMKSECCNQMKEPKPANDFRCILPLERGIGVTYPFFDENSLGDPSNWCVGSAGSGSNYCNVESSSSSTAEENLSSSGDSGVSSSSKSDYCEEHPDDPGCLQIDKCRADPNLPECQTLCSLDPTHPSCNSYGGNSSSSCSVMIDGVCMDEPKGGGSSGSQGGGSSGSGGECDDEDCDGGTGASSNSGGTCEGPDCEGGEPGGPGGGGSSGSGGNGDGDSTGTSGITCKSLKNCDWATAVGQGIQIGIEDAINDTLIELYKWLQYKKWEDSLLRAAQWQAEGAFRDSQHVFMDSVSGLMYSHYGRQDSLGSATIAQLNSMDSLNGLYYASSLEGQEDIKKSIDEGFGALEAALADGNGKILSALDSLTGDCTGDYCGDGNYSGIGDGELGGLDSMGRSGISRAGYDSLLSVPGLGGLQSSADSLSNALRSATATPFTPGMACPAEELSVDACGYFGGECRVSVCDDIFYINGRHVLEWLGVMMEFCAWVLFLLRIA